MGYVLMVLVQIQLIIIIVFHHRALFIMLVHMLATTRKWRGESKKEGKQRWSTQLNMIFLGENVKVMSDIDGNRRCICRDLY